MMKRLVLAVALLVGSVAPAEAQTARTIEQHYVTMSDGVKISVAVIFPPGFDDATTWPTLFEMDGYWGAAAPSPSTGYYGDKYVLVQASIRGTGCSGGDFELFSQRSTQDGYEIIEDWVVQQPWSNGRVGITGGSYPGLEGFYVAATNPPHVKAVAVTGLIDDYYRGILNIGGISNVGFPALWMGASRPASESQGNAPRYLAALQGQDPTCLENIQSREPNNVFHPRLLLAAYSSTEDTEDSFTRVHSLNNFAPDIRIPIHISSTYQDEQTGPRAPTLFELISEDVPKRLFLTNGRHGTNLVANEDRQLWLDCWVINDGKDCDPDTVDPQRRVRVHFETTSIDPDELNPPLVSSDFPLPETDWKRLYLRAEHQLAPQPPASDEAGDSYLSSQAGQRSTAISAAEDAPDGVSYRMEFPEGAAVIGPMALRLWASSTAPDTDFYVLLSDLAPDGSRQLLQRGLQRASMRAVFQPRSDRIRSGQFQNATFRPYHPFTNPTPIIPGTPYEYEIEIFPVGHVFRPGHTLELTIQTPPPQDAISSLYTWASLVLPGVNTLLHDQAHPSSILIPFLEALPPVAEEAPQCGAQLGVTCVSPSA